MKIATNSPRYKVLRSSILFYWELFYWEFQKKLLCPRQYLVIAGAILSKCSLSVDHLKGHECPGGEVDVAPDEEAVEGGEDAGQGHEEGGQREGYGCQPRPLIDQLTNNILVY